MINICLDLSAAMQQSAGISRYEAQIASSLVNLDSPEAYSIFYTSPKPVRFADKLNSNLAHLPRRSILVGNKTWRLKLLLWHILNFKVDKQIFPTGVLRPRIFHGMGFIAPPLETASVITILDLSFLLYPQLHSRYNRMYSRLVLPMCVAKASRILVISENTGHDLVNWLGSKISYKIRVTPLGVSDETYFEDLPLSQLQAELSIYNLTPRSYVLSVGTIEPRKNLPRLIAAYAELIKNWNQMETEKPALLLVGRPGWNEEYNRVKATATKFGLTIQENLPQTAAGQILLLTQVSDSTLKSLYQGAAVTCYPSLYEGFGLPALEALAAGSPLITSNNSSLPEVTGTDGGAALLINPTDIAQLTRSLQLLLGNQDLAQRLRLAGRERARLFTWKRTAELTRQAYHEIYSETETDN